MSNVCYKNADIELTVMGSDEFVLVCLDHPLIKRLIQHLTPEPETVEEPEKASCPEDDDTEEEGQYVHPTIYRNRPNVLRTMAQMQPGQWTLLRCAYGTLHNYRKPLTDSTRRYNFIKTDRRNVYRVECVR